MTATNTLPKLVINQPKSNQPPKKFKPQLVPKTPYLKADGTHFFNSHSDYLRIRNLGFSTLKFLNVPLTFQQLVENKINPALQPKEVVVIYSSETDSFTFSDSPSNINKFKRDNSVNYYCSSPFINYSGKLTYEAFIEDFIDKFVYKTIKHIELTNQVFQKFKDGKTQINNK